MTIGGNRAVTTIDAVPMTRPIEAVGPVQILAISAIEDVVPMAALVRRVRVETDVALKNSDAGNSDAGNSDLGLSGLGIPGQGRVNSDVGQDRDRVSGPAIVGRSLADTMGHAAVFATRAFATVRAAQDIHRLFPADWQRRKWHS
jgi:hypothetical protein